MLRRILLTALVPVIAFGCGGSSQSSRAVDEQLARPFPAEAQAVKESLVAEGDRAVNGVSEAVRRENTASPERIDFLFDVLTSIETLNAQVAMARLLDDSRPFVRGRAADGLADTLARCGIPLLINRLQDSAVYTDDVNRKTSLRVAEAAAEALQKLTGIRTAGSESPAERAGPFQTWWQSNGEGLQCSDEWKR